MVEIPVLAGCLLGVLLVAGQLARRRLRRRFPAPGRLIDIGGYRLHVEVAGTGPSPTIVLEGGTWASGAYWAPLVGRLAERARVVTYDRAGLGWSDPSPRPRTAPVMAGELAALLDAARVDGPVILVGHSFGATIVRLFAHAHPERVAGLVLLDPAHEAQFERVPSPVRAFTERMTRMMPFMFGVIGLLARTGLLALRPALIPVSSPALPARVTSVMRAQVASRASVVRTMAAEMTGLEAGNAVVRAMDLTLGDLPLLVVSHGRAEGTPPQLGADVAAEVERVWQELQVELAGSSSRGRRIVADGVGHDIAHEAPELVVEAIDATVKSAPGALAATA